LQAPNLTEVNERAGEISTRIALGSERKRDARFDRGERVSREDLDDEDLEVEQGLIACVIHKMHSEDTATVRNSTTDHIQY
jgi:hypothetical protein